MHVLLYRSLCLGRCSSFKPVFRFKDSICNQRYIGQVNNLIKPGNKPSLSAIPLRSHLAPLLSTFVLNRHIFTSASRQLPTGLPFEVNDRVTEDTLIYSYKNDKFYKLLAFLGILQFFFWVHLAGFSYTTLRDVKPKEQEANENSTKPPWWKRINLGENKYRNGIALLCISVGYLVLFISIIYPRRAVKQLWLLKGGRAVKIDTFGYKSHYVAPLDSISCLQQRDSPKTQIPLKMKGKWFHFLLDKKGVFHQEKLFDFSIGLKRNLN
ncbi:transmembrane protein 223 [Octopus sinensis]|uniref:Transmembrane protein 223 n=1 Tax=Octopus sinensis TaxID=2607531 RepID=A0A6P7SZ56_9MOLL|nr:transmembrane protein 223 [Octopus sinensis]